MDDDRDDIERDDPEATSALRAIPCVPGFLAWLYLAPACLAPGVDPEGHQPEGDGDQQPRTQRCSGELAQRPVQTLSLGRVEGHRGDVEGAGRPAAHLLIQAGLRNDPRPA